MYCVDATDETNTSVGPLMNHGPKAANLVTKFIVVEDHLHLCFFALRVIAKNEELFYDYGEKNKSIILDTP